MPCKDQLAEKGIRGGYILQRPTPGSNNTRAAGRYVVGLMASKSEHYVDMSNEVMQETNEKKFVTKRTVAARVKRQLEEWHFGEDI